LIPIFEYISGNWGQAVRLCEMRDVERWPLSRALKANALVRMGRYDTAVDLCREVQVRQARSAN
ncbi:unnamed protein product, partial [Discosporangium mesarthrocarpum]